MNIVKNIVTKLNLRIHYFIYMVVFFNIAGEPYLVVSCRECVVCPALYIPGQNNAANLKVVTDPYKLFLSYF